MNSLECQGQSITFGKYKGQPVEVLASDPRYCEWLQAQDWFRNGHKEIYNVIINNFVKPEDTPEHNKLQARFLDSIFLEKFLEKVYPVDEEINRLKEFVKTEESEIERIKERYSELYWDTHGLRDSQDEVKRALERIESLKQNGYRGISVNVEFEYRGWDAVISRNSPYFRVVVEIKPSIGDDFPTVLRQMKANKKGLKNYGYNFILLHNGFNAVGVTYEEMKLMFSASGIKTFSFSEVQGDGIT